MWGEDKQSHYREGRGITAVQKNEIEAVCRCGYLTLKPRNDFEEHNGGLTVKRSQVRIFNGEEEVRALRGKKIMRYSACNACGNDWR